MRGGLLFYQPRSVLIFVVEIFGTRGKIIALQLPISFISHFPNTESCNDTFVPDLVVHSNQAPQFSEYQA